jgi:predicted phosphate transport protein (TIGR00153 family)
MGNKVNFFNILLDQCKIMQEAMKLLNEFCSTNDEKTADEIIILEDKGDMARRILIDELNKTYFTPIDREDLFALSRLIDEITDNTKSTIESVRLFKVKPNEQMSVITATLVQMTEHTYNAVLRIEKHKSIARDEALKVKEKENLVATQFHQALAELFETDDLKSVFKYREIYKHLKESAEIADRAMDFLLNILVKM